MPTHAIPDGTTNFSVNLPLAERRDLGRLAYARGARSVGAFVRGLVERELVRARRSGRVLVAAGQLSFDFCLVAVFALGVGAAVASAFFGNDELRRGRAQVRVVRLVKGREVWL